MHADTALALRAERISRNEDPSLYDIGREVLGLDDNQARALFHGPNTAGSARRWIGTQAAAGACRALADGTAPEKLWEGKFDRLAIATAAAPGAGAAQNPQAGEVELGVPPLRFPVTGPPSTRRSQWWSRRKSTRAPASTRRRRSPPAQR